MQRDPSRERRRSLKRRMIPAASSPFLRAPRVRRVTLADFRSYRRARPAASSAVVALAGDNGAGKTNLLEALSLFTPGRGLRRAELSDLAREGGSGGFAVSLELSGEEGGPLQMGTGSRPVRGRAAEANSASTASRSPRRAPSPTMSASSG